MAFNFSSPEFLSHSKLLKNQVSPVNWASPAHINSPLQRQNIDIYVVSTASILQAASMANQASWQKLKLQIVLRIKPRIFSSQAELNSYHS